MLDFNHWLGSDWRVYDRGLGSRPARSAFTAPMPRLARWRRNRIRGADGGIRHCSEHRGRNSSCLSKTAAAWVNFAVLSERQLDNIIWAGVKVVGSIRGRK